MVERAEKLEDSQAQELLQVLGLADLSEADEDELDRIRRRRLVREDCSQGVVEVGEEIEVSFVLHLVRGLLIVEVEKVMFVASLVRPLPLMIVESEEFDHLDLHVILTIVIETRIEPGMKAIVAIDLQLVMLVEIQMNAHLTTVVPLLMVLEE